MIVFRNYEKNDYNIVGEFLIKANLDFEVDTGITYLALDNDRIIGIAKATEQEDRWYLDFIYIVEEERKNGFGDGLLRAILNKLRNNNINSIFYNSNSNYLINKGFCYNNDNKLELNIEKFFSTSSCGSCGG